MLSKRIDRLFKENERYLRMLEEYDRTGHLPLEKIRRSFTIRRMTYNKLKETAKVRKTSMSDLLDKLVDEEL